MLDKLNQPKGSTIGVLKDGRTIQEAFDSLGYLGVAVLSPANYGAKGDGKADDTTPLRQCVQDACALGGRVVGTVGAEYKISGTIAGTVGDGKYVELDFTGSKFTPTTDAAVMTITGVATSPVAEVTVEVVSVNLGNGSTNTIAMKVTAPGGHSFTKKGEIGKAWSPVLCLNNDLSTQYAGEPFVVGLVESSTVFYTTSVFTELYMGTSLKVIRVPTTQVVVKGLDVESEWTTGWKASTLTLSGLLRPFVYKPKCKNINGPFVNLTGCYGATVFLPEGDNLRNAPSEGAYGYFVNDSASFGSTIYGINCTNARHAYTTSSPRSEPTDDKWWLKGRTLFSEITNGLGTGCHNAFDTHSPSYGIKFTNCRAVGDFRGVDTGGAGFQIRGDRSSLVDCTAINSKIGAAFTAVNISGNSELYISGFTYEGPAGHLALSLSGKAGQINRVTISDSRWKTLEQYATAITNVEVSASNVEAVVDSATTASAAWRIGEGATLRTRGGAARFSAGSGHSVISLAASGAKVDVGDLEVTGSSFMQYLLATLSQYAGDVYIEADLDGALPGNPVGGGGTDLKAAVVYTAGNKFRRPLAYRALTIGNANGNTLELSYSGHDVITWEITATVAGANVNGITPGAFIGQQLNIGSSPASTQQLIINNGTNIAMGHAVTLEAGRGVTLYWNGANWRSGSV